MQKLNPHTHRLIKERFPAVDQADVTSRLLKECGQNLSRQKDADEFGRERIRFAALRSSNGDTFKLRRAIQLARRDWRDLLM